MKIAEYNIVRKLGDGGMSEVWEAENLRLGSRCALNKTALSEGDRNVYRDYALAGKDISEVAETYGISRNYVSQIKLRINKRIVSVGRSLVSGGGFPL